MKEKILVTLFLFLLNSISLFGQGGMDDFFRSTGKIYTVLAVVIILFLVIIFFLIRLESKINKLEKHLPNG